jgi:hypothetical protein
MMAKGKSSKKKRTTKKAVKREKPGKKPVQAKQEEKKVKKVTAATEIRTDVDKVVDLVGASPKDRLSLRKIKKRLNMPYDVIERWAKILDENKVLELVYPKNPFIGAYLQVKKPEYAEQEEKKTGVKKKVEGKEVGKKEDEEIKKNLEKRSGRPQKRRGEKAERTTNKEKGIESAARPKTGKTSRAKTRGKRRKRG